MKLPLHDGDRADSVRRVKLDASEPDEANGLGAPSPVPVAFDAEPASAEPAGCRRSHGGQRLVTLPWARETRAVRRLVSLVAAALGAITAGRAADVASRTLLLDATLAGTAVVTVGERGTILRSTDTARTWSEAASHSSATLTGVSFAGERDGWAVGHDALILATRDGGASWAKQWQGDNLSDSFLDVLALDARRVIAVGAYGLFLVTADGGHTWTRRQILTNDYHLNRISRGPTGTLYLAGEHGTLLRSTDDGANWVPIPTPYDGSFYGILPLGERSVLAYGLRGRAYRSDDDGGSWQPVATDETALLATGVKLRNGVVVLAGQARAVLVSAEARHSFVRREVGVLTGIAELLELPRGDLLAVGEGGAHLIAVDPLSKDAPRAVPTSRGEAER